MRKGPKLSVMKMRILGGLLLAAVAAAPAADDWRLIVKLQGKVESSVDNQASWQPVFAQRLLRDNDAARTMSDSKARIQLPDGSVAIMAPNTTAVLKEFDKEKGKVRLRVESGGVRAKVTKAFGRGRFELDTRNGVLAAEGTDYAVLYEDNDNIITTVYEGRIWLENGGQRSLLGAGQMARMNAAGQIQINPPGLNMQSMPPALMPDPSTSAPKEVGSFSQASGSTGTGSGLRFSQLNGMLLPSDAGRLGLPGSTLPSANNPAPGPPVNNTGTLQIDIRF